MKQVLDHGSMTTEQQRRLALAKHWLNVHTVRLTSNFKTVREASEMQIKEIYAEYPELNPEETTEQSSEGS